jgi:hypothetical protein
MRAFAASPKSSIQPTMEPSHTPQGGKKGFPSPVLVFIIVGVIVVAIAAFLIIRPTPPGTNSKSNASPASQH